MKCYSIHAILKAGERLPKCKFSLLVICKRFSTFLMKDHAHTMDIAYKTFYHEAYLFRPLVFVLNSL